MMLLAGVGAVSSQRRKPPLWLYYISQVALLHAGVDSCASTTQRQAFKLTAASTHCALG
jgi:hypothetical protein